MTIIPPHKLAKDNHLDQVIEEMRKLGAPVIKALKLSDDTFAALEGSHRLVAALELGLMPIIEEVELDFSLTLDDVVPGSFDDNRTLEEFVDSRWSIKPLEFEF